MLIVQNQMLLHAIVRSWTLLAALRAAHELLIIHIYYIYIYIYFFLFFFNAHPNIFLRKSKNVIS